MSFSGRVSEASHKGGLLISFEGRAPRLGASIRITGGRILGRVETVLGPTSDPLVHVHPVVENVDLAAAVGSPVEIAPRVRSGQGRSRRGPSGKRAKQYQSRSTRKDKYPAKRHIRREGGKRGMGRKGKSTRPRGRSDRRRGSGKRRR